MIARGLADAVVVGADRIAANGDVANKIGTYPLALAAARAGIPFVVAAPESTLDAGDAVGRRHRDRGARRRRGARPSVVGAWRPTGSRALNPAFDVTPADLVTAIVTERRVIRPALGRAAVTAPPVGALLDLTGRVVVVTGVSGGIGQGIARRLRRGRRVRRAALRRDRPAAEVLAAELGERALVVAGDLLADGVADARSPTAAVERFGRLDGWVNNAGVQPVAALTEMTADEFDDVVAGNAPTTFRGTQAAAHRMTEGGAIVNVASIEALQPAVGHSHYVRRQGRRRRPHQGRRASSSAPAGIRVNAVAPGLIDRPGLDEAWPEGVARWLAACPLGRLGQPRRRRRRLPVPAVGGGAVGDRRRARRRRRRAGPTTW